MNKEENLGTGIKFLLNCTYLYYLLYLLYKIVLYETVYEHKRHDPVNRAFSAPLVHCSIAPVLLSVCRVAQLCRVVCLCRLPQFVQYLCTGDIE